MSSSQWSEEQLDTGGRKLAAFRIWQSDNRPMYEFMERTALRSAARGLPISGRDLIERARRKAFVDSHGKDSRINNDYAAIVARKLYIEHPECRPYIERRSTVFDELMLLV